MHFKLIIALVADEKTEAVIAAAKAEGATGASVVNNTRGEGLMMKKTFLGLELDTPRNKSTWAVMCWKRLARLQSWTKSAEPGLRLWSMWKMPSVCRDKLTRLLNG